jgi:hypothetical protein
MSVSKGFLDNLDVVLSATDGSCTCEKPGLANCKSCAANELVEHIYMEVEDFIQQYGQ